MEEAGPERPRRKRAASALLGGGPASPHLSTAAAAPLAAVHVPSLLAPQRLPSAPSPGRLADNLKPGFYANPFDILSERVVIVMVGLPARGKSYISKAIWRYLQFLSCPARMFNAGNKRRTEGKAGTDANFFNASNLSAKQDRERMAMECLDELLDWLQSKTQDGGSAVGIFDATNTTKARRRAVVERVALEKAKGRAPCRVLFVESMADDERLLERNYRMKLFNDDYKMADPEQALADFRERVRQYESVYEHIEDTELDAEIILPLSVDVAYVKLINAGKKVVACNCAGSFILDRLLGLLHSIHLGPRCLWFVLMGETTNDIRGVLGGDSLLSYSGREYGRACGAYIYSREHSDDLKVDGCVPDPAMILCGTLRRNIQMAEELSDGFGALGSKSGFISSSFSLASLESFNEAVTNEAASALASSLLRRSSSDQDLRSPSLLHRHVQRLKMDNIGMTQRDTVAMTKMLNELCAGRLDSMTYESMRVQYPDEFLARESDKLNYRYPGVGGESYQDLILRLEEVILTMERCRDNLIVICDKAVQRVLVSYFLGTEPCKIPYLETTSGVIELRRSHSGYHCTRTNIEEGASSPRRGNPPVSNGDQTPTN